jgi:hypothetical protein
MKWTAPKNAAALSAALTAEHPVNPPTACSGCHR